MTDTEQLRRLLTTLRERWWLVLLPTIAAGALAYGLAKLETPLYESRTAVLFEDTSFDQLLFGQRATEAVPSTPTSAMNTNVRLLTQRRIAQEVDGRLDLPGTPRDLRAVVDVAQEGDSRLVTLSARDPDPERAARIADTWVQVFLQVEQASKRSPLEGAVRSLREQLAGVRPGDPARRTLERRLNDLELLSQLQTAEARVTERAEVSDEPVSPRPLRRAALGTVAGFLGGLLLIFLLAWQDRRIRTVEEAEALYEKPVLGTVPHREDRRSHAGAPWLAFEEGFRTLRGALRFYDTPERPLRVILVTSAQSGDGKSTTCAGLGIALAGAGRNVVCVDADLRRPNLAPTLGQPNAAPGLADLIVSDVPVSEALVGVPFDARADAMALLRGPDEGSLRILPAGTVPPNPAELVSSHGLRRVLEDLKADPAVDVVLIDSPPVSAVGDALVIAPFADAVVLAVQLGRSTSTGARRAVEALRRSGAPILGLAVLGGKPPSDSGYYYHRPLPAEAGNGSESSTRVRT